MAEKGIRINVELPEIFTLGKSVFKIFKASSVSISNQKDEVLTYEPKNNGVNILQVNTKNELNAFPSQAALTLVII